MYFKVYTHDKEYCVCTIQWIVHVTGYIILESFFLFELKVNLYLQNMSLSRFDQKRIFVVICVQLVSQHH